MGNLFAMEILFAMGVNPWLFLFRPFRAVNYLYLKTVKCLKDDKQKDRLEPYPLFINANPDPFAMGLHPWLLLFRPFRAINISVS